MFSQRIYQTSSWSKFLAECFNTYFQKTLTLATIGYNRLLCFGYYSTRKLFLAPSTIFLSSSPFLLSIPICSYRKGMTVKRRSFEVLYKYLDRNRAKYLIPPCLKRYLLSRLSASYKYPNKVKKSIVSNIRLYTLRELIFAGTNFCGFCGFGPKPQN